MINSAFVKNKQKHCIFSITFQYFTAKPVAEIHIGKEEIKKCLCVSASFYRATGLSSQRISEFQFGSRVPSLPLKNSLSEQTISTLESVRADFAIWLHWNSEQTFYKMLVFHFRGKADWARLFPAGLSLFAPEVWLWHFSFQLQWKWRTNLIEVLPGLTISSQVSLLMRFLKALRFWLKEN